MGDVTLEFPPPNPPGFTILGPYLGAKGLTLQGTSQGEAEGWIDAIKVCSHVFSTCPSLCPCPRLGNGTGLSWSNQGLFVQPVQFWCCLSNHRPVFVIRAAGGLLVHPLNRLGGNALQWAEYCSTSTSAYWVGHINANDGRQLQHLSKKGIKQ